MLLTVTDDIVLKQNISELCIIGGIFSYVYSFDELKNTENLPNGVTALLVDGRHSKQDVKNLYTSVMSSYPDLAVAILISEERYAYKRFTHIIPVPDQLSMPVSDDTFARFVLEFYFKNVIPLCTSDSRLQISRNRADTALLGYRLKLTHSEHRILLLLSSFADLPFTAEELGKLCLKSGASSSVPVHICNINQKSKQISLRNIIISEPCGDCRSYRINKDM